MEETIENEFISHMEQHLANAWAHERAGNYNYAKASRVKALKWLHKLASHIRDMQADSRVSTMEIMHPMLSAMVETVEATIMNGDGSDRKGGLLNR